MTEAQPAESLDALLERAEKTIARLSDGRLPLEELVLAYGDAGRLIAEAEARFASLRERAEQGS